MATTRPVRSMGVLAMFCGAPCRGGSRLARAVEDLGGARSELDRAAEDPAVVRVVPHEVEAALVRLGPDLDPAGDRGDVAVVVAAHAPGRVAAPGERADGVLAQH